jgi:hypothetical protein
METPQMVESEAQALTDRIAYDTLTAKGIHPVELCFVLRKGIRRWNPEFGLFQAYMIDRPDVADACRTYLKRQGRCFDTTEECKNWAASHNWPNLERLFQLLDRGEERRRKLKEEAARKGIKREEKGPS